jgi:hypothetical protein
LKSEHHKRAADHFLSIAIGLLLFGVATAQAADVKTGILLIEVRLRPVSDLDVEVVRDGFYVPDSFKLRHLGSGKRYSQFRNNWSVRLMDLPEGIYCVDSARFGGANVEMAYCGEPYFKVVAGRVNNVGTWRFGVDLVNGKNKLYGALENLEGVLAEARNRYPKRFEETK